MIVTAVKAKTTFLGVSYLLLSVSLYYFYNSSEELQKSAVVFALSAFFSWFDFGLLRRLQFKWLGIGQISSDFKWFAITLIISSSLFIYLDNDSTIFVVAILNAWLVLLSRLAAECFRRVFQFNIFINFITALTLLLDTYFYGELYFYFFRSLFALVFIGVFWREFPIIPGKQPSSPEIMGMQISQVIPGNFERLFAIESGATSANLFFVAEMINRLVPVFGQFINSIFFEKFKLQIPGTYNRIVLALSVIVVVLNPDSDILLSLVILSNSLLSIPLYLSSYYNGNVKTLTTLYILESLVCLSFLFLIDASLLYVSAFRFTLDHFLLFTIRGLEL